MQTNEIKTAGIASTVIEDDVELGHVLMLDLDDVDEEVAIETAESIAGPAVVLESSRGSYHVYGLRIRSWDRVVSELEESAASGHYVREMIDRERCVLRTQPKLSEDNDVVTPEPKIVDVIDADEDDLAISYPHLAVLRQLPEADWFDGLLDLSRSDSARGDGLPSEMWSYSGGVC